MQAYSFQRLQLDSLLQRVNNTVACTLRVSQATQMEATLAHGVVTTCSSKEDQAYSFQWLQAVLKHALFKGSTTL